MQARCLEVWRSAAAVGWLDEWSSDMERCDMGMMCDYATAGEGGHRTDRCRERVSFEIAVRDLRRMTSCAGHLATVLSEMVGKYTQEWVRVYRR